MGPIQSSPADLEATVRWPDSEMGRRFARHDWPATGLGDPAEWPTALSGAVSLMLRSGFPMFVLWGPRRVVLYNDAYAPILGPKHPAALGQPFWAVWAEVRDGIEPVIEAAFQGRESFFRDFQSTLVRGRPEPAWFTFSYSPIMSADGEIPGVLCVCLETSQAVLATQAVTESQRRQAQSEARLRFLDSLNSAVMPLTSAGDILATTTRMVGEHLNLSCCAYADMDEDQDGFTIRGDWSAPGSPSIVGHYSLADFGTLAVRNLGAGQPLVINNNLEELAPSEAKTFQDIGITATICMPLVKDGRLTALMAIHDRVPRQWTDDELSLIREVTARSWAHVERVGAEAELRASHERFRAAVQAVEGVLWTNDAEGRMTGEQPGWAAITGQTRAEYEGYGWSSVVHPDDAEPTIAAWQEAVAARKPFVFEHRLRRWDGQWRHFSIRAIPVLSPAGEVMEWVGVHTDITDQRAAEREAVERARSLQVLNTTGAALAAELDLHKVVQLVTDAGVGITGAQFGAFFYNLLNEAGESYMLYALSGVDRSAFEGFPMPRNTKVFAPTFAGEAVVRSDDITKDPRYGHNAPRQGMPDGHLPVRSYLAVPVISRSGEVLGGLFFGHSDPGVFTAGAEELVRGVGGQAAVAIDNARLYQAAQREIEQRRRGEAQQLLLINELNHRVKNTLATVQSIVAQTSRSGRSAQDVRTAIEGRLLALSTAHDLLTRHSWEGADLRDVVDRAIAPFDSASDRRISTRGPSVPLTTQQALAISMALHELATNATKYGSLSVPGGRVTLNWEATADSVRIEWQEHGGPPVSPPPARGFGSRLLERGLASDLQGQVALEFRPEGVRCEICAPVHRAAPQALETS